MTEVISGTIGSNVIVTVHNDLSLSIRNNRIEISLNPEDAQQLPVLITNIYNQFKTENDRAYDDAEATRLAAGEIALTTKHLYYLNGNTRDVYICLRQHDTDGTPLLGLERIDRFDNGFSSEPPTFFVTSDGVLLWCEDGNEDGRSGASQYTVRDLRPYGDREESAVIKKSEEESEQRKEQRKQWSEAGLCVQCGAPRFGNFKHCEQHEVSLSGFPF